VDDDERTSGDEDSEAPADNEASADDPAPDDAASDDAPSADEASDAEASNDEASNEVTESSPAGEEDAPAGDGAAAATVATEVANGSKPAAEPRVKRHRGRKIGAALLVALTAICVLGSVIGVWVHRSVYNESEFTAVVTPVSDDPAVLDPLATYLTVQALQAIDLQGKIDGTLQAIASALPNVLGLGDRLQGLGVPLSSAAHEFVQGKVQDYLHSEKFRQLFNRVVVAAHGKLVALVKGDYSQLPNLNVSGPTVYLNTIPILADILRNVAQSAANLVGLNVTIPQIEPGMLPDSARALLGRALNVSLPPNFGQVPIMTADQLHSYQNAAKLFNQLVVLLIVLSIVFFAGAVLLSVRRRRTLVQLGLAIAGTLLFAGLLLRAVIRHVVDGIQSSGGKSAAHDVATVMGQNLRDVGSVVLWVAVAIAVVAYLAGRPKWLLRAIAATRRVSVDTTGGSSLARFVAERYDLLVGAAAGVALILLAIIGVGWVSLIVIGLLLAAAIWWLTAVRAAERAQVEPAAA
jgi:hypothetical protein